jgi:hypothetical protein
LIRYVALNSLQSPPTMMAWRYVRQVAKAPLSDEVQIMDDKLLRSITGVSIMAVALIGSAGRAASADLGGADKPQLVEPAAAQSQWSFAFTTYGWLPWMSGDAVVKGRAFDVQVNPSQMLSNLDWSGIPAWMSYAEARNGRLSLFNDIVYAKLAGSADFAKSGKLGVTTLVGNVKADDEQAVIEAGAAYEVWGEGVSGSAGFTGLDVLAGGRYWHQEASISADLALNLGTGLPEIGGRVFAKSGSVDWVDPFIGARLRHQLAPGQELVVRGDVGGFGVGSDFTWQAIATYNWQMCTTGGHVIDAYLGYRALSVDYSQGSGNTRYEFNVLQQGPVIGATLRF